MIFSKIKVLRSHGRQSIPDLNAVEIDGEFRGRPSLCAPRSAADANALAAAAALCPTGALRIDDAASADANSADALRPHSFSLDLGRCLFCGECARRAPQSVCFTTDYRMASPTREGLILRPNPAAAPDPTAAPHGGNTPPDGIPFDRAAVRPEIGRFFSQALQLREVSAGGDNSVEMELNASGNVNFDLGRFGIGFTASPRHADGVVITGPITANMAQALQICYDAVAEPKILIVCGSEACSGGLFAGSRAVDRSFLASHTPDLWVPGAPTHPMTFIDGIMTLTGRKTRETSKTRDTHKE